MSAEYPGLLHCYRCDAHYTAGHWYRVRWPAGTTDNRKWLGAMDDNDCPICRRPPLLVKPVEQVAAM